MKNQKKSLGKWGENKAASHLISAGYELIAQNFTLSIGEIDLIVQKDNILYFFEVKTRSKDKFGQGFEAIPQRKIQRIIKTAETYIVLKNLDMDVRIGVISILGSEKSYELEIFLL
jgi:putative endonuclease